MFAKRRAEVPNFRLLCFLLAFVRRAREVLLSPLCTNVIPLYAIEPRQIDGYWLFNKMIKFAKY